MSSKIWKTIIEKMMKHEIKTLRTDNDLEFVKMEFLKFCSKAGIVRHWTCVDRAQQNRVAEKMNKTLLERTRCMLSQARLKMEFWAEVGSTVC